MSRNLKYSVLLLAVVSILTGGGIAISRVWQFAAVAAAYKAKILCSGVFVSQREPQAVLKQDLNVEGLEPLRFVDAVVSKKDHKVTADIFGIVHRSAIYRPGLGCTLAVEGSPSLPEPIARIDSGANQFSAVNRSSYSLAAQPSDQSQELARWPPQELATVFHSARLDEAVNWAFSEPDAKKLRRTRAIVILYRGKIAAEKYAAGFDKNTPLIGWSMTKSVVNALVGILVRQGKLDINKPAPITTWQSIDDPRHKIVVNQLLHMDSGLRFVESYDDTLSDVTRMLFEVGDSAAYATGKNLSATPGSLWSYSSGSPVIVCRIIQNIVGDSAYLKFPRRALFAPLGMRSAVIEVDAAGTLLGSSFMYASPRDWARFGQFYLQDGVWEGRRILPKGWVKYSTTPVPISPGGEYGSYFWVKLPKEFRRADKKTPLPEDAFHAAGYDGQLITIIPSARLVIVRMGLTRYPVIWPQDQFVSKILDAMKNRG
jgi:CubicO group peptidase (beta-lactamase class C family)